MLKRFDPAVPFRMLALVLLLSLLTLPGYAEAPLIGLIYSSEKWSALQESGRDKQALYRAAIEENGGEVLPLSQDQPIAAFYADLRRMDGLIIPGGIDIAPKFYAEEKHPKLGDIDAEFDRMEWEALDYADRRGLPVLGICRGHQLMNVFFGGTMIQDIPSEHHAPTPVIHRGKGSPMHEISIVPGTLFHTLLKAEAITVNTLHHQAVEKLAPGFVITARSADGIVEAIERPGPVMMLGVQFHPEKLRANDPRFNAFFERLIQQARISKATD